MKKLSLVLLSIIFSLTFLWLLAEKPLNAPFDLETFSESLIQYTGIIAMGAMSIAMILATRPIWLSPQLGGLDKSYRLHKWLGITAFAFSFAHLLSSELPSWLGWSEDEHINKSVSNGNEAFGDSVADLAGELALTIYPFIIALLIIALVKKIPYHWFVKTHRLLAIFYLGLVFHVIALMDVKYWMQPIGVVVDLLMLGGIIAAFLILFNQVGKKRKAKGIINIINKYDKSKMLEIIIKVGNHWKGHQAGQFAFLTLDQQEKPHPFTISSAWVASEKKIGFTIKALGDYTATLAKKLKIGTLVIIEGPYGCFTFESRTKRQIWIGGGVGLTPFLARMEHLKDSKTEYQVIDFFYAAKFLDKAMEKKLIQLAKAARIQLHLYTIPSKGRITGDKIRTLIPDWQLSSVWFCGPIGMGQAIQKDFKVHGFDTKNFHQELFEMR